MGVKYRVNEAFFDAWSPQMAYVLGYLYADGSMEDASYLRGKYIRVTSTDFDRIKIIRELLESQHTIVPYNKGGNYKTRYLLRIGSHALYARLIKLGVTPHKSLTMDFPRIPDKYLASFVRGYFDGDGCAYLELRTNGRPKRLLTVFTSGSKQFLQKLHTTLKKHADIRGRGLYKHGSTEGTYQLRYSSEDSMRLYRLMYRPRPRRGLFLKRKYAIFTRYFKLHSSVPRSRLKIGHVVKG